MKWIVMSLSDSANITFDAALLQNPEAAMQREWLVTNELGGYASSSVGGANTRRYHVCLSPRFTRRSDAPSFCPN